MTILKFRCILNLMAFKNAFRILFNRFSVVWVLAAYILVVLVLVIPLSLFFLLPIVSAFEDAGILTQINDAFSILLDTGNITYIGIEIQSIWRNSLKVFRESRMLTAQISVAFVIFILIFKFLLGFYELAVTKILDGSMGANAKLGFIHSYISLLRRSVRFVAVKLLYTLLYDLIFFTLLYILLGLFSSPATALIAPFLITLYVVIFVSLRYALVAFWAPFVGIDNKKIFNALGLSIALFAKNFRQVYGGFLALWLLIIALNVFIGLFTFGVGLIATIPISMLIVNILNMTFYYTRTGKRFYADDKIITPPPLKTNTKENHT